MADDTSTKLTYRDPRDRNARAPQRVELYVSAQTVVKVLIIIGLFWVVTMAIGQLTGVMIQLSIAAFLAVAADPVVRRMEQRGMGRGRAVLIVMVVALALMALVVSIFVPPLADQGDKLIDAAPGIVADVTESSWYERLDNEYDIMDQVSEQAAELPGIVSKQLGSWLGVIAAGLFGAITILFLTIFLLLGGGQLVQGTVRLFPMLTERRWWTIVQGAYTGISAYVGGAIIIALIGGAVVTISALAMGLPYALPLGLWMMLLEIIPMVGATIGAIPAIIVAFVSGGTVQGIAMMVIIIVHQQVENNYIQPRVQGKAASLTPLTVFLSVIIGSQLLGVLGALFAVPVAGVILILLRQIIEEQGNADVTMPPLDTSDVPPDDEAPIPSAPA